jgi:hypothetical protein
LINGVELTTTIQTLYLAEKYIKREKSRGKDESKVPTPETGDQGNKKRSREHRAKENRK